MSENKQNPCENCASCEVNSADHVVFDESMLDYTILVPTMLPNHFKIMTGILRSFGYNAILLENYDSSVIEYGLKYVHNDTC